MNDPIIIVEPLERRDKSSHLTDHFKGSFHALSLTDSFDRARAVFIKPNLCFPVYKRGATTRREFIESLVSALREINSNTTIYIGEGDGGYNSFSINDTFHNMNYYALEKKYPKVKILNLSEMATKETAIDTAKGKYVVELPRIFFDEIDFSISCPVPKVHCMTRLSLSYKNLWGCLPDVMRLKHHYMFDYIISKISYLLKFKYAFLDGKFGLNVNGPVVGDPVEIDWFAASNSLGAFDSIVAEMMGFNWRSIRHLQVAEGYGFIPIRESITVKGDVEKLKRKFYLKRDIWNYPALIAFYSKKLTHLVYFSKWAKLIHDVMYTFKKKPITF